MEYVTSEADSTSTAASPYSTGGGGTVLEHRYGAIILAHLLSGDSVTELGDDVAPVQVTFQASAFSSVDDLVISGRSADGNERRVSIGVRRDPSLVPSEAASVRLVSSYLRVVHDHWPEVHAGRWRLALAVASPNTSVRQVAALAGIAREAPNESLFRTEVARPGRTSQPVRSRLKQLDAVVVAAADHAAVGTSAVPATELTWRLLSALRLRELRLEGVDEVDRTTTVTRLRAVTRDGTPEAGDALFSRLAELAGRYAPAAATMTETSLRRDLAGTLLGRSPACTQAGPRSPMQAVDAWRDGHDVYVRQERGDRIITLGTDNYFNLTEMASTRPELPVQIPQSISGRVAEAFDPLLTFAESEPGRAVEDAWPPLRVITEKVYRHLLDRQPRHKVIDMVSDLARTSAVEGGWVDAAYPLYYWPIDLEDRQKRVPTVSEAKVYLFLAKALATALLLAAENPPHTGSSTF